MQPHLLGQELGRAARPYLQEGGGGGEDEAGAVRRHGGRRAQDEDRSGRRAQNALRVLTWGRGGVDAVGRSRGGGAVDGAGDRIDVVLSLYLCRSSFARLAPETKRNYTDDYCLFFDFLWGRGKVWSDAPPDDLWDFEDWRTRSPSNPRRVGGSRWNRGLAALAGLYDWAVRGAHVVVNPVVTRFAVGRRGEVITVPAARAKNARASEVHWLAPRAFHRWVDVGLRGHGADGGPSIGWGGRLEDRNASFADLLFSSGTRLTEGASLLTFEIPGLRCEAGMYVHCVHPC